ncbi:plasmid replication protein RepC [Devosia riboflavina]
MGGDQCRLPWWQARCTPARFRLKPRCTNGTSFTTSRRLEEAIGATDRALAILDALLSFHPETAFYGDSELIVWPSNAQLINRAYGMSPATLRRHLANLVDCGLVIRRDSPNGKRFARKTHDGDIEQAYGFDLSPLVARAVEFKDLAAGIREERSALRDAKSRLTLTRRDITKMIEAGVEEGVPGDWGRLLGRYQAIIATLPRSAARAVIAAVTDELDQLWSEVRNLLENFINSQNLNANKSQNERHKQNSNPEPKYESESRLGKLEEDGQAGGPDNVKSLPKRDLPLHTVLEACPKVRWLSKGEAEIRNWRDFMAVIAVGRPVLGISPSAWNDACEAMGEREAAIVLAAIYQKQNAIRSPGGYLRNLTERARRKQVLGPSHDLSADPGKN